MIRRLTAADADSVPTFLNHQYVLDPASGGTQAPSRDWVQKLGNEGMAWLAEEGGAIVGMLGPALFGVRVDKPGGPKITFVYFYLLAVEYTLYGTARDEARRIARELTLAAADDIQGSGKVPDEIRVGGPKESRGGHWCVELGMELIEERGGYCTWRLPFALIWERAKATER